jgi:hypothetical protein
MPHVFDHRPTEQEVFDAACTFFATSPGPSVLLFENGGNQCKYHQPETGRACAAGYFIPDDVYEPGMDDPERYDDLTDVRGLNKYFGEKLPVWFAEHQRLLMRLQNCHDDSDHWTGQGVGWRYKRVTSRLEEIARTMQLGMDAIEQVRALIPEAQREVPAGWREVQA